MSEQEKTTGGAGAGGSSLVMVESGARHKQPYRPTELQEENLPEMHHKRSRAPAVPSVAEELKAATEAAEAKERKETERAMSSEKFKSNVAKKLSSNTKRRSSSPEAITLAPLEVETKRASMTSQPQPIPARVESMATVSDETIEKIGKDRKEDEDSITEEIAELRTSVAVKPSSEWCDGAKEDDEDQQSMKAVDEIVKQETKNQPSENTDVCTKKKEISWNDEEYLQTVNLKDMNVRSHSWAVERKASIGPYLQSTPSFGGPSGITICIPKKSRKGINEDLQTMPSVINITVSKKSINNRSSARLNDDRAKDKLNLKVGDAPAATFFGSLRIRMNDLRDKIRNSLNI